MEKNVKATQKLLLSLKTLPSFQQLKDKHLSHLLGLIGKSSWIQIGPASELVDSLDGSVWSEQDLVTLKSAITQKITSEGMQGTRRPLQNYCALPRYLTQDQWTFMQTNESQQERVEKAVSLAGSLGLRCPSETTTACIVWIACCAFRGQEVSDHLKYQCLQEYKAKIKKWLSGLPPPAVYLTELPTDVEALPDVLRAVAFPTGRVPGLPAGLNLDSAFLALNRFPLRKTNLMANNGRQQLNGISSQSGSSAEAQVWHAMGQMMAAMASGMRASQPADSDRSTAREAVARPKVPLLALTNGSVEPAGEVDRCELPNAEGTGGVAALRAEAGDAPSNGDGVMASELQTLRDTMGLGAAEPAEKTEKNSAPMKRPSGKKVKKIAKRPAGRQGDKKMKKAKGMKRPAGLREAPAGRGERSAGSVAQPEGRHRPAGSRAQHSRAECRARLLASIPAKLRKQYKDGCPTCRWRPECCTSCWHKRGFH